MTNRTNPMTTADAKDLAMRRRADAESLGGQAEFTIEEIDELVIALEASPNSRTEAMRNALLFWNSSAEAWMQENAYPGWMQEAFDYAQEALAMQAVRPIDQESEGASPLATGLSQAEPEVSALRASIPSAVGVRRGFELISAHIEYTERENGRLNELLSTYYVNALRGDAEQLVAFIKNYGHDVHRDRKTLSAAIGEFHASAIEAAEAGETTEIGSTEGESAVGACCAETPELGPIAPVQDDER